MSLDIIKTDLSTKISKKSTLKEDSDLILRYITQIKAQNSELSSKSITTEYECLLPWTKYMSFSKARIDDIYSAIEEMDNRGLKKTPG